jgi:hypothetical protein
MKFPPKRQREDELVEVSRTSQSGRVQWWLDSGISRARDPLSSALERDGREMSPAAEELNREIELG